MKDRQDCGCVHDGTHWLKLCDACTSTVKAVHERWAIEHKRHTDARAVEQAIIEELI